MYKILSFESVDGSNDVACSSLVNLQLEELLESRGYFVDLAASRACLEATFVLTRDHFVKKVDDELLLSLVCLINSREAYDYYELPDEKYRDCACFRLNDKDRRLFFLVHKNPATKEETVVFLSYHISSHKTEGRKGHDSFLRKAVAALKVDEGIVVVNPKRVALGVCLSDEEVGGETKAVAVERAKMAFSGAFEAVADDMSVLQCVVAQYEILRKLVGVEVIQTETRQLIEAFSRFGRGFFVGEDRHVMFDFYGTGVTKKGPKINNQILVGVISLIKENPEIDYPVFALKSFDANPGLFVSELLALDGAAFVEKVFPRIFEVSGGLIFGKDMLISCVCNRPDIESVDPSGLGSVLVEPGFMKDKVYLGLDLFRKTGRFEYLGFVKTIVDNNKDLLSLEDIEAIKQSLIEVFEGRGLDISGELYILLDILIESKADIDVAEAPVVSERLRKKRRRKRVGRVTGSAVTIVSKEDQKRKDRVWLKQEIMQVKDLIMKADDRRAYCSKLNSLLRDYEALFDSLDECYESIQELPMSRSSFCLKDGSALIGGYPLVHFVAGTNPRFLDRLVKINSDCVGIMLERRTTLMTAASEWNLGCMKVLLDAGVDVNHVAEHRNTVLSSFLTSAVKHPSNNALRAAAVHMLLDYSKNPRELLSLYSPRDYVLPLSALIRYGFPYDLIKRAAEIGPVFISESDYKGRNPIDYTRRDQKERALLLGLGSPHPVPGAPLDMEIIDVPVGLEGRQLFDVFWLDMGIVAGQMSIGKVAEYSAEVKKIKRAMCALGVPDGDKVGQYELLASLAEKKYVFILRDVLNYFKENSVDFESILYRSFEVDGFRHSSIVYKIIASDCVELLSLFIDVTGLDVNRMVGAPEDAPAVAPLRLAVSMGHPGLVASLFRMGAIYIDGFEDRISMLKNLMMFDITKLKRKEVFKQMLKAGFFSGYPWVTAGYRGPGGEPTAEHDKRKFLNNCVEIAREDERFAIYPDLRIATHLENPSGLSKETALSAAAYLDDRVALRYFVTQHMTSLTPDEVLKAMVAFNRSDKCKADERSGEYLNHRTYFDLKQLMLLLYAPTRRVLCGIDADLSRDGRAFCGKWSRVLGSSVMPTKEEMLVGFVADTLFTDIDGKNGVSDLQICAMLGDLKACARLVERLGRDPKAGVVPLAAKYGNRSVVAYLLSRFY